jgi:hypothetical protein
MTRFANRPGEMNYSAVKNVETTNERLIRTINELSYISTLHDVLSSLPKINCVIDADLEDYNLKLIGNEKIVFSSSVEDGEFTCTIHDWNAIGVGYSWIEARAEMLEDLAMIYEEVMNWPEDKLSQKALEWRKLFKQKIERK